MEEAIQENTRGEVIYFWAHLDVDHRVLNSDDGYPFWSVCDIFNRGLCRYVRYSTFSNMVIITASCSLVNASIVFSKMKSYKKKNEEMTKNATRIGINEKEGITIRLLEFQKTKTKQ